VKGEFLRDLPILLPAENPHKVLVLSNGAMGFVGAHRISSESSVVGIDAVPPIYGTRARLRLVACIRRGISRLLAGSAILETLQSLRTLAPPGRRLAPGARVPWYRG
jgi:hypothetical protein